MIQQSWVYDLHSSKLHARTLAGPLDKGLAQPQPSITAFCKHVFKQACTKMELSYLDVAASCLYPGSIVTMCCLYTESMNSYRLHCYIFYNFTTLCSYKILYSTRFYRSIVYFGFICWTFYSCNCHFNYILGSVTIGCICYLETGSVTTMRCLYTISITTTCYLFYIQDM